MSVIDHVFAVKVGPPQAATTLEAALDELRTGGGFMKQDEQQIGEMMYTVRWLQRSAPPVAVDLTFDASVPMLMVSVLSDSDVASQTVSTHLLQHLGVLIDSPEQTREAASADPGNPSLLVRAAVAFAQRFDGKLFSLINNALRGEEPELRQAAAKSSALVKYSQLLPALNHAVEAEGDETTARMLALALAKCQNPA